jgi:hypothetical protein
MLVVHLFLYGIRGQCFVRDQADGALSYAAVQTKHLGVQTPRAQHPVFQAKPMLRHLKPTRPTTAFYIDPILNRVAAQARAASMSLASEAGVSCGA